MRRQPPPEELRGTVQKFKDAQGKPYWRARATLADGARVWVGPRFAREIRAREYADEKTREAQANGVRLPPTARRGHDGETCDEYFDRLSEVREADGVRDVRKERTIWGKWISPRIGTRPIAAVTRDEIEDIRNALDEEVKKRKTLGLEHGIAGTTAMNVWSVLRTTFKEATAARDRALRARTDDPTHGHKPPLRSPERTKTFVYPTEMAKLLACAAVPRAWRETYAVASYTYLRPEELEALLWSDVDFDAGVIQVSKSVDARTGNLKPIPKTAAAVRAVPIEASLLPLLVAMHERRASDAAPVLPALRELDDKHRAKQFREHLRAAGVTRSRLFADTLTLRQVDFRSCRDTGITWLALAGVQLPAMQRRCGHEDVSQTMGYVKMAEDLSGAVGAPFPPMPPSLLDGGALPKRLSKSHAAAENKCRRRESNAAQAAPSRAVSATIDAGTVHEDARTTDDNPANAGRLDGSLGAGDAVEAALAKALDAAAAAGRFDVVAQLAKELEARRLSEAKNVVSIDVARRRTP
jgi:integrase